MSDENNKKVNPMFIGVCAVVIAVIFISIIYFNPKKNEELPNEPQQTQPVAEQTPQPTEPQTQPDSTANSTVEKNEFGTIIKEVNLQLPQSKPNLALSQEEATNIAKDIAVAAQTYYDKYNSQAEIISKYGYVFDYPSEMFLDTQLLIDGGDLDAKYNGESAVVIYVKPEDLKEVGINVSDTTPIVICGTYETEKGIIIMNAKGEGGVITKEQFLGMMQKYSYNNNGTIIRYNKNAPKFTEIVNAVKEFSDTQDELDVRYLASDDKYAFAAVSPVGQTTQIKAYVLTNENNVWSVKISDLEKEYQFRVIISGALPYLNVAILPEFNLYFNAKYLVSNLSPYVEAMKNDALISEADGELAFGSGDDEFLYLVFESGKKFICNKNEDGIWVMHQTGSYEDAESFIKEKSNSSSALFITKQE